MSDDVTKTAHFEVDEWTVLMAIRYGLGRLTYANADAASLAWEHWDRFSEATRQTITQDVLHLRGTLTPADIIATWDWITDE